MTFDTLAVRALNSALVAHKPTYAGLRLLLSGVGDVGEVLSNFLRSRVETRNAWRYYEFEVTKRVDQVTGPEYRVHGVGSPLTLLAESYILAQMACESTFATPSCAFSYRWPKVRNYGRNFEYYYEGYCERDIAIRTLLAGNPGSVAVVLDIKRFYPSVDKDRLTARLETKLAAVEAPARRKSIEQFAIGMLSTSPQGIPIGPDLSHAMGHIALEAVDAGMTEQFEGRYLRYVDDVVVVCDPTRIREAKNMFVDLLGIEGLSRNEDKDDTVPHGEWEEHARMQQAGGDLFDELTARILRYLLEQPGQFDAVAAAFRNEGFMVPLGRLRSLTKSRRYRSFLSIGSVFRRLLSMLTGSTDSVGSLVGRAYNARYYYNTELDRVASMPLASPSMRRRWQVQRWRRVLGRTMYLHPTSAYGTLHQRIPAVEELAEVRAVIAAVFKSDCTEVLSLPGKAVATFTQLWQTAEKSPLAVTYESIATTRALGGAASDMALLLNLPVPSRVSQELIESNLPGTSLLLDLCNGITNSVVKPARQSYLDELACLFRSATSEPISDLFTSRYDEREDVGLEALSFGNDSDAQPLPLLYP